MANEKQLGLGMARHVSRYVGAFVGKVVGVGAEIVGACEKRAKAAGDLFSGRAKISEKVAGKVPKPSLKRVVPEPSEGAEAKVEVRGTAPVVRGTKVKAKSKKTTKAGKKKPKKVTKAKTKKPKKKVKAKPKKTTKATTKSSG